MNSSVTYAAREKSVVSIFAHAERIEATCSSADAAEPIAAMLTVFGHLSLDGIAEAGKRLANQGTEIAEVVETTEAVK